MVVTRSSPAKEKSNTKKRTASAEGGAASGAASLSKKKQSKEKKRLLPSELSFLKDISLKERIQFFKKTPDDDDDDAGYVVQSEDRKQEFELKSLFLDQLRGLGTLLGIAHKDMKTKDGAMTVIAHMVENWDKASYNLTVIDKVASTGLSAMSHMTYRLIGILFSPRFRDRFRDLTKRKDREDFENGEGPNNVNFYADVLEVLHDDSASEHKSLLPCENEQYEEDYDQVLESIPEEEHPKTPIQQKYYAKSIKQQIDKLKSVRQAMIEIMEESGRHKDRPDQYAVAAIKRKKHGGSVDPRVAYYFYMQCLFHDAIATSILTSLAEGYKNFDSQNIPKKAMRKKQAKRKKQLAAAEATSTAIQNMGQKFDVLLQYKSVDSLKKELVRLDKSISQSKQLKKDYVSMMASNVANDTQVRDIALGEIKSADAAIAEKEKEMHALKRKIEEAENELSNAKKPAAVRPPSQIAYESDTSVEEGASTAGTSTISTSMMHTSVKVSAHPEPPSTTEKDTISNEESSGIVGDSSEGEESNVTNPIVGV